MDYGTLKSRTKELLGRDALSLSFDLALDQLNKELRIRSMEKTATIAAASGELDLPDDFLAMQSAENVTSSEFLTPIPHERRVELSSSGTPTHYVVGNDTAYLDPKPDDGHEVKVIYYAEIAGLTNDSDTNVALTNALEAYCYTVLAHHARLIRNDKALAFWDGESAKAIATANRADLKARMDGGTIETEPTGTIV